MSAQKKRGLGRGLGALIPTGPEGERPIDVFFPGGARSEGVVEPAAGEVVGTGTEGLSKTSGSSARTTSWDAALSSGRLGIRTSGGVRPGSPVGGEAADDASQTEDASVPDEPQVLLEESSGVGPAEIGVITGSVPTVDGSLATVTQIGAVRVPNSALATKGSMNAAVDAAFGAIDLQGVSRETTTPNLAGDSGEDLDPRELTAADDLLPVPGATFAELPVNSIRPNTWQPRTVFDEGDLDELVDSIREIGVLQPIVVRPDKREVGSYELIMGERRWRATQLAGLETVPAIVRETDDADMLRDALLENLHRAQLNPLEEAAAYRQLLDDFGCTHEELATRIARSRPQISNTLRLLKLPPLVQRRVAAGILSAGHARALLSLTDGAEIERLAQRIVSEGLSVRAVEEIVTIMSAGDDEKPRRAPRAGQRSIAVDELAGRLSDLFETRVKVQVGKTKGRLTVEFASVEDLNRILTVMALTDPGLLKS